MLRCKKGDLAILLRSDLGNEGKIVDVLEFSGRTFFIDGSVSENCWDVSLSGSETDSLTGLKWSCPDHWLFPIRPGDLKETEEAEREVACADS